MLKLTYDDILLVPKYSRFLSRDAVDISSSLQGIELKIPIVASPMSSVTGIEMQQAMKKNGGMGVHHRYNVSTDILAEAAQHGPIAVSPSMTSDLDEIADKANGEPFYIIDVAHGDSWPALELAEILVKRGSKVVSGNICTGDAARRYRSIGVNMFRVGVGPGSACSTRIVSGCGYPQFSAIQEIRQAIPTGYIIADGGIKNSGDIVKALMFADVVMCGRLLAGTNETPPVIDLMNCGDEIEIANTKLNGIPYYGMASERALKEADKELRIEGVEGLVPYQGAVIGVLSKLAEGIKAGFAYIGAQNLKEFHDRAKFIQVTQNGIAEGRPRI